MFDVREVSWIVAIARIVLSMIILVAALAGIDLSLYLGATDSTFNQRVDAAFKDSFDYGYIQTFDAAYQKALTEGFDKGYTKGIEISRAANSGQPASRLIQTHNPTYAEMKEFLANDTTHLKPYIEGQYVCFDYAADLNSDADAAGIQCAYVSIRSQDWGHAVVAFDTVDKGLIFIEPQTNSQVDLAVGKPYPWLQSAAISPTSASEPIVEMDIIW